ncbi:hypothetical protein NFI96_004114 [Prochilodus magdalenae]|nr:hypothetical protein NFI96_004114 [Prochilodus magdalenae]
MGEFWEIEDVNQDNVVKVGHKQVVNMIRHGGNHLIIKVVTVSRNLDPDDKSRKKAPPPPRRAPSTALSTRSKSMTSELEDLDKVEEVVPPQKPVWDSSNVDVRVAAVKPRPTSRFSLMSGGFVYLMEAPSGFSVELILRPSYSESLRVRSAQEQCVELHGMGFHGEQLHPSLTSPSAVQSVERSGVKLRPWTLEQWRRVLWSNQSRFSV